MNDAIELKQLLERTRAGDQDAAREVVARYAPAVRRVIRHQIEGKSLRAQIDSMDICQAAMASFFVRDRSGGYALECPEQLRGLLMSIAKHKLAKEFRRQRASRRDVRRTTSLTNVEDTPGKDPSPSARAAAREIAAQFALRLSAEERFLAEQRSQGRSWSEIAKSLAISPESARKRLARAAERIAQELKLDESFAK